MFWNKQEEKDTDIQEPTILIDETNDDSSVTWQDLKYDKEFIELMDAYHNCVIGYYDFTQPFQVKLRQGKHLTKSEILTLTGIIQKIKNKDLQNKLYQTILEELVLIVTGEDNP